MSNETFWRFERWTVYEEKNKPNFTATWKLIAERMTRDHSIQIAHSSIKGEESNALYYILGT